MGIKFKFDPIFYYFWKRMNCYWCDSDLIIGGDVDIEEDMGGYPEFSVMTNLSCPRCGSQVEVLKKRDAFD